MPRIDRKGIERSIISLACLSDDVERKRAAPIRPARATSCTTPRRRAAQTFPPPPSRAFLDTPFPSEFSSNRWISLRSATILPSSAGSPIKRICHEQPLSFQRPSGAVFVPRCPHQKLIRERKTVNVAYQDRVCLLAPSLQKPSLRPGSSGVGDAPVVDCRNRSPGGL